MGSIVAVDFYFVP